MFFSRKIFLSKSAHFLFTISILFICSCSVQKRQYRSGLYFENIARPKKAESVFVSKEKSIILPAKINEPDPKCDTLFLKKNEKIFVCRIVDITESHFIFRQCGDSSGGTFKLLKSKVDGFTYVNKEGKLIATGHGGERVSLMERNGNSSFRPHELAFLSFLVGLTIIGGPYAMALALNARNDIRHYPEKFYGWKLAKAGLLMGIIGTVIWIAFFIVIILSVSL